MTTQRLSALDAAFLAVETPTAHMHVGWAAVFEPPAGGPAPGFEELRDHVACRLRRTPRSRQMLKPVPLGLNAPVWVDDPNFDICRHVVAARSTSLTAIVDEAMSESLDRDRPLWQICIAPRLDDGRIGVVGKAHHCMVDGIAAVEFASLLLDPVPDPAVLGPDGWRPRPGPRRRRLVLDGAVDLAREQLDLATLPARLVSSPQRAVAALDRARRAGLALADAVRPAPRAPQLNQPISPLRRLGLLSRPLEDLMRIKDAFGVKLNDVLLAVAAGGVREFLRERGDPPLRPKAMVPVNVRGGEDGALGNRISFMFVDLPCDEPDPRHRLRELHAATMERKEAHEPEGAETVISSLGFTPAPLQRLVSRLIASPRAFNLVVSNIPGPSERLYMRGCPLVEAYPVVPIADQHALSIGVTTIGDGAFFGLYADRKALPDVDRLARDIDSAIDELLDCAETPEAERQVALVDG